VSAELPQLPDWPRGTVAVLTTAGPEPHAIPVSAAVQVSSRLVLFALARRRESLRRLRADPRVALTVLAAGDVAATAHGSARVVADPLAGAENVVALALTVDSVQDHRQPRFVIEGGVRWRWTDQQAAAADAQVHAALQHLGATLARGS
jgi:hypothetical protein